VAKETFLRTKRLYRLLLVLPLVIWGCSTHKDAFLNRSYHRTAAHYNSFFNAEVSFEEGIAKLEKTYQEDYSLLLPSHILGDKRQAQKVYPQMDRTITKAYNVIDFHSMEFKGKERNKWVDDSYFLIGQANFYKQDYTLAIETFNYISREYKELKDVSVLWATRAHVEQGNYTTADKNLQYLYEEARFKSEEKALLAEVNANLSIHRKDWVEAIDYLIQSMKFDSDKAKRVRFTFIIAQLYQLIGDYDEAYEYFHKVVNMNPDYEFLFNASLSRARAFNPDKDNADDLIREIKKMLEEDKNIDYKDQIYYALAEIALKEDHRLEALEYLHASTASSINNDSQKSISHLKLADLYFDEAQYLPAQGHYDTAMMFVSTSHEDYETLMKKRNSLNQLVELYTTIQVQDSLIELSHLPEEDLLAAIDAIIEQKKEEDAAAKTAAQAALRGGSRYNSQTSGNQRNPMAGMSGAWYFYNTSAVSFGYSEFLAKWGERKLEDNWRRKNKNQIFLDEDGELLDEDEDKDVYSREYYLDQIPLSDSARLATQDVIIQAFYQLGLIYKEDLQDYDEAIEVFELLKSSYPENDYDPATYYQLYRLRKLLEEDLVATTILQALMKKYPNSEFVEMILEPEAYARRMESASVDSLSMYYESIYDLFLQEQYDSVMVVSGQAKKDYANHSLGAQFSMLYALSSGYLDGEEALVTSLNDLLSEHSKGEVSDQARAMLQSVERMHEDVVEPKYSVEEDVDHYYILAVDNEGPSINKLKIAISDYNLEYHQLEQLNTQSLMLNLDYQLIIVRKFSNSEEALLYYDALKNLETLSPLLGLSEYEHFIISSNNFSDFYKDKKLDEYIVYFENRYLNLEK
jgi:tetratricopeptide (TPR) repeat protein